VTEKTPRTRSARVVLGRIAAAVAGFIVLVVVTVALLPSSVWRSLIVHVVAQKTGRPAAIDGDVHLKIFSANPELIVEGFSLGNADWAKPKSMLTVKRFDATVSLVSLLRFRVIFPRVAIDTPVIDLERDASGRANWDFSKAGSVRAARNPKAAPMHVPVIQELTVNSGVLTADDRIRKLKFDGQISIQESQNTADDHALKVRGTGELNNKPFELHLEGAPLINVRPTKPYEFSVAVTAADIKLNAHTEFPRPFDMAAVRSTFKVSGSDLADVYYLTGLALPNTPPYDVSGTLERDKLVFRIDDLKGKLGSSDIEGKVSIDTGHDRPKLTATLTSKQFAFADLASPLGSQATPERKTGTLAKPTKTAPAVSPAPALALLLPDADLQVNRVRGMDADVDFESTSVLAPKLPMKKVHLHVLLDDGKIVLNPLTFVLPQGQFSGTVTIDARAATPETSIDMKLSDIDMSQFKSKTAASAPLEGHLLGRIRLRGSGTSVHKAASNADGDITVVMPQGQMREVLAELTGIDVSRSLGLLITKNQKDTEVRCGVANFHADDGDLKATTLVVDTTHVLVTGDGHVNLKTEALDLSLRGQPKEVRIFRIRAPILLKGSLLHPTIGVQPGKLAAQTGGAVALGTLLTPLAALLAFVDGGLAKDANCAALIGQAEQGKNLAKE
jgi:AsmA family protein